jgi:hypothetical protein
LQGIEASFQFLATSMGHEDEGTKNGLVGSIFFFCYFYFFYLKNDMYECDKGEEMNPKE